MNIVDLSEDKTKKNLLNLRKEKIDYVTGEIIESENLKVQKFEKQDDFIQFFVENLDFVNTELDPSEKSVLFGVITKMDYGNIIAINSSIRKTIMGRTSLSKSTISRGINGLIDKKVLLPIDTDELKTKYKVYDNCSYLVNPNIVGKGSFRELKRLRRMVITDFDFKNFSATKEIISETEYLGFDEIKNNQEQYQVKEINQEHDETKKMKNTEIVIEEKNNPINNQSNLFNKKEESSINNKALISNDTQPSLFDENQKEREARLFVEQYAGILTGGFDPTKSAKELKREKLDKDLEEGRI
ncbi:hypothetical protein [Campylobacter coli]|uniref:hypothetical protein n=1 Tax=Campylobacter coli TaxID=195 RepID=UPI0011A76FDB|nr:hypothetical protein [Campylobacter coli]